MTDRVNALIVVLEKDMRDDDIEHIKLAIMAIRGVLKVNNNIVDTSDYVAQMRANSAVKDKLFELIKSL